MSLRTRKTILWLSVIVLAITLLFFWAKSIPGRLGNFQGDNFFEGWDMPKIEVPEMPEINLEELYGEEFSTTTEE